MEYRQLCESDYRFMSVIWDHEPVSSGELVKLCREELGWKKSTVYTMLRKLAEKELVQNLDSVVTALIPREQAQAIESTQFVEQKFSGSLPRFLCAFLGEKPLSEEEAEELRRLIDEHQEGSK